MPPVYCHHYNQTAFARGLHGVVIINLITLWTMCSHHYLDGWRYIINMSLIYRSIQLGRCNIQLEQLFSAVKRKTLDWKRTMELDGNLSNNNKLVKKDCIN